MVGAGLNEHLQPLYRFVTELRSAHSNWIVPDFDPLGPGTSAKIMHLGKKPGKEGAALTGLVSLKFNTEVTATIGRQVSEEAGVDPNRVLAWNVVPWYDGKRDISAAELKEGIDSLRGLLPLLPGLRAVVLVGQEARKAKHLFEINKIKVFESAYPSIQVKNVLPEQFSQIAPIWRAAQAFAEHD